MIKVVVKKEKDNYKKISIMGHAMYDTKGKDIVCSAVSSIGVTTINAILSLDGDALTYEKTKAGLFIIVNKNDNTTQVILRNMINLLKDLEKHYCKNIKVID